MDFNEFCVLMARILNNVDPEEEIREAYRCFTKNAQGQIPEREIRETLQYILNTQIYKPDSLEAPLCQEGKCLWNGDDLR